MLIDQLEIGALFHTMSWSLHKAKRPVKWAGAAETLAAGEETDVGKEIVVVYGDLFRATVNLVVTVDSKDLFSTLTSQRQSIHRSIRASIRVIRYEFETKYVHEVRWVPGKHNLADAGAKFDSSLNHSLLYMLSTGLLPFFFPTAEFCVSDCAFGKYFRSSLFALKKVVENRKEYGRRSLLRMTFILSR